MKKTVPTHKGKLLNWMAKSHSWSTDAFETVVETVSLAEWPKI